MAERTQRPTKPTGRKSARPVDLTLSKKTPLDLMSETYLYVKYNAFLARTPEDLKRYGLRSSGDAEIDKELQSANMTTQLNIWAIFDLWQRGVKVSIVNYNDTKIIYEIVHHHLMIWRNHLASTLNEYPDELLQELIDLDIFTSEVYGHASNVFNSEDRTRIANKSLPYAQRISMANIFKPEKDAKPAVPNGGGQVAGRFSSATKTTKTQERVGFAGIFAETLAHQQQWRPIDSTKREE